MQAEQTPFPTYQLICEPEPETLVRIYVLTMEESEQVPELHRPKFKSHGKVVVCGEGLIEKHYVSSCKASTYTITVDSFVNFSAGVSKLDDYWGIASDLLTSAYKFTRKQNPAKTLIVSVDSATPEHQQIIKLVQAKNRSKEWGNSRGDKDGVPSYFEGIAQDLAAKNEKISLTIIKGDDLLEKEFRLMHAVGRASKNEPVFINLRYQGNPDSDEWVAFVGKGVCFDAGGLNIKPTSGIKDMYLDKHGAVSVFSAFETIVEEGLKINLTCSMGYVENFVGEKSYRPSDIIRSRKGITVEIGNTDAEGRLVLADCMHWTQCNYKVSTMIELSTLTGAMIMALGHRFAGMFGNSDSLKSDLIASGKKVHEEVWEMPLVDYHRNLVKHKFADITNSSGKTEAGSSQAAAFLENFVEKDIKWVHLDVAGMCIVGAEGTGYGSRLLVQYARNISQK